MSTNETSTIYISYLQIHIDIDREESCHYYPDREESCHYYLDKEESCHYYLDREESCHYNLDKEESCHYNLDREESRPSVSIPTPGEAPTTQAHSHSTVRCHRGIAHHTLNMEINILFSTKKDFFTF